MTDRDCSIQKGFVGHCLYFNDRNFSAGVGRLFIEGSYYTIGQKQP